MYECVQYVTAFNFMKKHEKFALAVLVLSHTTNSDAEFGHSPVFFLLSSFRVRDIISTGFSERCQLGSFPALPISGNEVGSHGNADL